MEKVIKIDPKDNVLVALKDFKKGDRIGENGTAITLETDVDQKHKFAIHPIDKGLIHQYS